MSSIKLTRIDVFVCIALFSIATLGSYVGYAQLKSIVIKKSNVWFQADIGRVYKNMTEPSSDHSRTKVHPLFSLTTAPVVYAVSELGLPKESAVRLLVACMAGLGLVLFYFTLRHLSIPIFDSIIFSAFFAISSAAIFWTTVPETYLFGSITILVILLFMALAEHRVFTNGHYIGISALSLSMTVTNWMAGIAATLANNSLRRTIRITVDAFVVVTVLWAIQHAMFPTAEFFLLSPEERNYMLLEESGGIFEKTTVFFFLAASLFIWSIGPKSMHFVMQ